MTNVTQKRITLTCWTCLRELDQRTSKKEKPYFVCEYCGVQVFFRLPEGIERLRASITKAIIEDDFILCRRCQIAIRRSKTKISDPLFGTPGIRCPECGDLLIRAEKVAND